MGGVVPEELKNTHAHPHAENKKMHIYGVYDVYNFTTGYSIDVKCRARKHRRPPPTPCVPLFYELTVLEF